MGGIAGIPGSPATRCARPGEGYLDDVVSSIFLPIGFRGLSVETTRHITATYVVGRSK